MPVWHGTGEMRYSDGASRLVKTLKKKKQRPKKKKKYKKK